MSDDKPESFGSGFLFGWLLGWFMGFVFHIWLGPTLGGAQERYTRCIADGAPKERCIEIYLLPPEEK